MNQNAYLLKYVFTGCVFGTQYNIKYTYSRVCVCASAYFMPQFLSLQLQLFLLLIFVGSVYMRLEFVHRNIEAK